MSDNKQITVPVIKYTETIDIKFSGAFLARIYDLYFGYVALLGNENCEKPLEAIRDNSIDKLETVAEKEHAVNLETLLILIKELEKEFQAENKITENTIDLPSDDTTED
jgi:hypothetical protein